MKSSGKKSKIQWLRYFCLASLILFFILVPLSNRYANYKISYNQARLVELADGPIVGGLYQAFDSIYTLFDDPVTAATSNNGSLWAYTVFGIPISDPLGLLSELINSVKFPVKYLLGGLIPFIITLLLGRIFCSWFCPMVILFGITKKIRKHMIKIGVPLLKFRLEPMTSAFLFWAGLVISYFMGAWVWHFILPYIAFTNEIFSIVVFSSLTVGIYILVAVLVLDIAVIPGEFCRSVCPTGFMLTWIGKFSWLRLKANKEQCIKGCSVCKKVCPEDLFVKEGLMTSCHLCYKCVDSCPKNHIVLGVNPIYDKTQNLDVL